MPRNGKGGPRQGAPATAYGNRTDLNGPPAESAALGGTSSSVGAPPSPNGSPPSPDMGTPGGGGGGNPLEALLASIPEGSRPGQLTPLNAPSARPDEPTTAGMPLGAGPGPEALGAWAPGQATPDMIALARYLPALELMQSTATSQKMRTMIRLLRASIPLEARNLNLGEIPRAPENR